MRQSSNVAILYSIPVRAKPDADQRSNVKSDTAKRSNVTSDADDGDWFAEMARALHPEKPDTAFWAVTAFDERLCQKYAAGHVRPSAYFLRRLLRSRGGWTYYAAVMDGCTEPWWLDLQEALAIGNEALRRARRVAQPPS